MNLEIKGFDGNLPVEDEEFSDPDLDYKPALWSGVPVEDSYIAEIKPSPETERIRIHTENGSTYTLNYWNEERTRGLLKGRNGLVWLYDHESQLTAYYDGDRYVAANNPDIRKVWGDLLEGPWLDQLEK